MEIVGLVGILVALVLFLVLTYKGFSAYWTAPVCGAIVAVSNMVAPVTAINNYLTGITSLVGALFFIVFGGAVLGKVFTDTGAAESIASSLIKAFVKPDAHPEKQVRVALLAILIFSGLCTMGGIDGYVLTFTVFPICVVVAKMVDIPRRFLPAMICLNCAFMAAPGAPQINNIMAKAGILSGLANSGNEEFLQALGNGYTISATAGLIPGIVSTIIIAVGGYFTLSYMIIKAKRNSETFDYGPMHQPHTTEGRKLPNVFVAVIPLVVVFFLYTILPLIIHQEVHIMLCLSAGIIVNLLLMGSYVQKKDERGENISLGKAIVKSLNNGAGMFPSAFITVVTPAALAGVITGTAAFGMLVGKLYGFNIHYIALTLIAVFVIVAITSSPPAALMVALPIVITLMLHSGMSADVVLDKLPGIARVAAISATTFETLPFNGLIVLTIGMAGTTHKTSYRPQLYMTVLWTTVGALVAAGLVALGL